MIRIANRQDRRREYDARDLVDTLTLAETFTAAAERRRTDDTDND
jgi:hypothetical protein